MALRADILIAGVEKRSAVVEQAHVQTSLGQRGISRADTSEGESP
jgi:hypothetical protein